MQSTQKLTKLLRDLVLLIDDEASHNPAFAERLAALLTDIPSKKSVKQKPQEPHIEIPDVVAILAEKGEVEFRHWLQSLDLSTLKLIIKTHGFDPGKVSQRWADSEKLIALIIEQAKAHYRRGSAFLS